MASTGREAERCGTTFSCTTLYKGPARTFDRTACFHSETNHLMLYREVAWGLLYDSHNTRKYVYTVWAKWRGYNAKLDGAYISVLNEVE